MAIDKNIGPHLFVESYYKDECAVCHYDARNKIHEIPSFKNDSLLIGSLIPNKTINTSPTISNNPKDRLGIKKVPLHTVLPIADAHESCAMLDGELKYGYRNFRNTKVSAKVYIDAALRHLAAYAEGEDYAKDSGVHHLGHLRACAAILLDAAENGNLIDDRVKGKYPEVAERLAKWVEERIQKEKNK